MDKPSTNENLSSILNSKLNIGEVCMRAKNPKDLTNHHSEISKNIDNKPISNKIDQVLTNLDEKLSALDQNVLAINHTTIEDLNLKFMTLNNQILLIQTEINNLNMKWDSLNQLFLSFPNKSDIKQSESSLFILLEELFKKFSYSFKNDLELNIIEILQKQFTQMMPDYIKSFESRLESLKEYIKEIEIETSKSQEIQKSCVNKTIESYQLFESTLNEIKDKMSLNLISIDQTIKDRLEKFEVDIQNLNQRRELDKDLEKLSNDRNKFDGGNPALIHEISCNTAIKNEEIVKEFNKYYSNFNDILDDYDLI